LNKLTAIEGRVIVSIDIEKKNSHRFSNGTVIRLERNWNNLDRKSTQPVNAICISGEGIKPNSEILIHHNMCHDTYRIFNYRSLSGEETGSDIRYYSIPSEQCYAWRDGEEWKPLPNFSLALRVFKPYNGILTGIEPKLIKNVLYILDGEYKGMVCHTLRACDFEIRFQGTDGREHTLIRCRPNGNIKVQREPEVIGINHEYTKMVNNGELYVGINVSDAKPIKDHTYA
jgi:hypothetical protein